jgi:short-subunit dehydrogenase
VPSKESHKFSVLVTGGSSQLWSACFPKLESQLPSLLYVGRSKPTVFRGSDTYLHADFSDIYATSSLLLSYSEQLIHIKTLILIHGIDSEASASKLNIVSLERSISLNFIATSTIATLVLDCTRHQEAGLSIVYLSSRLASAPIPNSIVYSTSKAASEFYLAHMATDLDEDEVLNVHIVRAGALGFSMRETAEEDRSSTMKPAFVDAPQTSIDDLAATLSHILTKRPVGQSVDFQEC